MSYLTYAYPQKLFSYGLVNCSHLLLKINPQSHTQHHPNVALAQHFDAPIRHLYGAPKLAKEVNG
jgi:hypothetical protein